MRKIKIKHLEMEHFKGVSRFECDFGDRTTICGANGTGKSTIMDAFTWCLFGKDAKDRTDSGRGAFGIKTTDANGNVIEKLEHWVEITLDVDGAEVKAKRQLSEKWTKRRGSTEVVLDGNETKYYWMGIEVKKSDYDKYIASDLIDDATFKAITNPNYFCSLPWEQQKQMLASIIGNVTYADIADQNDEFRSEYETIKAKNMAGHEDEYRKSVASTIRKTKDDISATTHQIEGMRELVPQMPDIKTLDAEAEELSKENDAIEAILRSRANLEKAKYEKISKLNDEIVKMESQQRKIKSDALDKANESRRDAQKIKAEVETRKVLLCNKLEQAKIDYEASRSRIDRTISNLTGDTQHLEAERNRLLEDYYKVYDEQFDPNNTVCPYTSASCPAMIKAGEEKFEKEKSNRLKDIQDKGKAIKAQIDGNKTMLEGLKQDDELEALKRHIEEIKFKYEDEKRNCDSIKIPDMVTDIDPTTLPEYMKIEADKDRLEAEINDVNADNIELTDEQKDRKAYIKQRLAEIHQELGKVKVIDEQNAKIDEYEAKVSEYTQNLADAEREEDILNAMRKAIDTEIERRCSMKFEMVKFKLSEQQINGGEVATCYAMVDGVKYADLNSAKKVNAGLDIINAICRHLSVYAPIFIDNAEGINKLIETDSQMIRLVVTEDKELKVE